METHQIQKKQFINIFTIELWERFAFYTFNTLFVLFAISTYFTEKSAYLIFGIFMALAYGLPTLGGYIADKLLGIKRTLIVGAVLLTLGYFVLSLANTYEKTLIALSVIIIGNALFKPNPSSLIGMIYKDNSANTNAAFTMYYMAINIGSLIATVFSPLIAQHTSFQITFVIACIGMFFSLANFILKYKLFSNIYNQVGKAPLSMIKLIACFIILVLMLVFSYTMLDHSNFAFYIILGLTILCYGYLFVSALANNDKNVSIKQVIGTIIFIQALLFFIIYTQMFSTLVIFAKNNIDLNFLGFKISPASYTSLNPFWILTLSPVLAKIYTYLHSKNIHSSTAGKYTIGMFCCAIAYLILILAVYTANADAKINGMWMVIYYFLTSLAELLISAIGLSVAAQYFPSNKLSFCMGAWLLAQGCGNAIAGKLAGVVAMPSGDISPTQSLELYKTYFFGFFISCLVISILFLILNILVKKISKSKNITFA